MVRLSPKGRTRGAAAALALSACALCGCGESSLGAARVTLVQVKLLSGTVRDGPPPPWTLVLLDEADRSLSARDLEGDFSDCSEGLRGECPYKPAPGRLRVESLGFAGLATAQIGAWPLGHVHRQAVERFSARNVNTPSDTIAVGGDAAGQPAQFEWQVLARCAGRVVSTSSKQYKDSGSGVIGIPRFRAMRWTELHAPCVPPP
jgi:hypothetical protein